MIFGRPTSLWVGLISAAGGTIQVLMIALVPNVDAGQVAIVIGAITGFLGIFVAFLANQPPPVTIGGQINLTTPSGQPNILATVSSPTTITPVPTP